MSKAAVFDLGKVLLDFDYGIAARNLAQHSDLSAEAIRAAINQSPLLHRYETGLMTTEEFFAEVKKLSGFRGELVQFEGLFADIFAPIPAMIELHAQLSERGIPTFIFSNTNDMAVRHIRANYPFFQNFTGYVFSHEARAMKPTLSIYEAVERLAGRQGNDLVYIDDRPENIDAAKGRGWHAILHESPEQTIPLVTAHFA
jgi:HAD superfamily hydrolase (TIGR01509 family)